MDELTDSLEGNSAPLLLNSNHGKLDCKALYDSIRERGTIVVWKDLIWNKLNTPRISFMAWKIVQGGVSTKVKIKCWGMIQDEACSLCTMQAPETWEHLWFECDFSKKVLSGVLGWAKVPRCTESIGNWISQATTLKGKKTLAYNLWNHFHCVVMYHIWRARNEVIFSNRVVSIEECISICVRHIRNCLKARWSKRSRETSWFMERLGIEQDEQVVNS